ncbi:MAG: hypothetical protein KatS3mg103_0500 [Phycisphaerales bacterium]|nr:MAG: hypothetical protein KatS3mg103_0500 [Phycisphaerales bacterium]
MVRRRGIAVLVVLVVIALGALAGTVALLAARAAGESAGQVGGRVQSYLTLRSGVLVLGEEAARQREAVLGGQDLELALPVEIAGDGDRLELFDLDETRTPRPVPLDALLDVNTCDAAMLARLPGVDQSLAEAIAARLPVRSLDALLEVEGVTARLLYGVGGDGRSGGEDAGAGSQPGQPGVVPLAALLTVGSGGPCGERGGRFQPSRAGSCGSVGGCWTRSAIAALVERVGGPERRAGALGVVLERRPVSGGRGLAEPIGPGAGVGGCRGVAGLVRCGVRRGERDGPGGDGPVWTSIGRPPRCWRRCRGWTRTRRGRWSRRVRRCLPRRWPTCSGRCAPDWSMKRG